MQAFYWIIAAGPPVLLSLALHWHASKSGRQIPWFTRIESPDGTFVDPRLNEAYAIVKRFAIGSAVLLLAFGIAGGLLLDAVQFYYGAVSVAIVCGCSRRLFLEGAIAFGAELNPSSPAAVEFRAPGTA